ncbi:MAG TPA: 2-dehydropantoate 2-reductase [Herbaspirillum sp.]
MKILILGAGAIGGYYGARLIEAGGDVTFLVRPQRQALIEKQGLIVESELGRFAQAVKTATAESVKPEFDLVLLTCKSYDLAQAMDAIAPALQAHTAILPFLNGLVAYDALDARFGKQRILGGVAYIATMLMPDGSIAHRGNNDTVLIGARSTASEARAAAQAFYDLFAKSPGIRKMPENIEQALWDKWVMICSGALMCCLMRGTVKDILHTQDGRRLMEQAMRECAAVAEYTGYKLSKQAVDGMRALLLDENLAWAASMMRDIDRNLPRIEADGIVGDMLKRATQFGFDVHLMRAAYCHLQVYMAQRSKAEGAA